jgi:hypothetical protein
MRLTIPAELWGLITYILVYLWGCSWLVGWQKRKLQACIASLLSLGYFQQSQLCAFYLCLSGHIFLVQKMRHNRYRRPYELRICDNVTGTLFRMRSTFCWTVRMNILSAFAHSTASLSFHISMGIAQLVWGPFWTNQMCMVWSLLWLWMLSPFPLIFLAPFWFDYRLLPSFRSDAPQRHI